MKKRNFYQKPLTVLMDVEMEDVVCQASGAYAIGSDVESGDGEGGNGDIF